jgi:predicted nucleotide-binding protein
MIVDELKDFRDKLLMFLLYRRSQLIEQRSLAEKETNNLASIYNEVSITVGRYAPLIKECTGLSTIPVGATQEDIWNWAFRLSSRNTLVVSALDQCVQAIGRTIGQLEDDIRTRKRDAKTGKLMGKSGMFKSEPPKAFIAHEGETRALNILKEFLEALGIQYFIAESKASNGRSIEKQVNWTQSKADFAICLATKGKTINKKTGKHYMALNIADELGRARQVFGNKIILLEQKGLEPHTNIREIVYENFTTTNMEKAFIKIAKELANWGFITVGTLKEHHLDH